MSRLEPDLPRLLESLNEGVWQRDIVTGQAWYSPRYKQLLGYADHELPNDAAGFAERVHPDDREAVDQVRQAAMASFEPCSGEGRMRVRSGDWRWFRATVRVWPDAEGRPAVLMGSVTDVHAEKQAALDMKALAERFDRAMAASSEAHFERTAGDNDFYMSPRLPTLLGYPAGTPAPSAETFMGWVHPDDREGLLAARQRAASRPGSWDHSYRLRHLDGSYRWFSGRGRSEWDDQGGLRITGMIGDIHAQKLAQEELAQHREQLQRMVEDRTQRLSQALAQAEAAREAAERANLAKATFLGHMSHELRTPLNGVMGMTQLALRLASSETQRRYLGLAEQSGQSLLRILDDVLDFAKAEAGKLQLVDEVFDLPRLVAETVRGFMPQVGQRPLHVMYDAVGTVEQVRGDAGRVRQIVSNLVSNALKFTERGTIEVVVEANEAADGACRVRLEVRDTGIGMDEATMQRVFEAFEQADSGRARHHGGTGLGLPIVRLLAQRMGGTVQARSAPGVGSTFAVDLHLAMAPQAAAAPSAATGRAWLVFRTPAPGTWVQARLRRVGWAAEVVDGIDGALARLQEADDTAPDCVIVADEALDDTQALVRLRDALPARVTMVLLFRPDFQLPLLHEAAAASGVRLAIAPLTAADLRELLRPAPPPPPALAPPAPAATAPTVLVVEDMPMNQLIVTEMIRLLGLRAGLASSGEEALRACQRAAPDLVLMDIQMPGMDGLETTRRLRALQASDRLPPFPIVALTANAMESDRQASRDAGIDEHVAKPIDLARLRSVLARWLPGAGLDPVAGGAPVEG